MPSHVRNVSKGDTSQSGTFAPSFIKSDDMRRKSDVVSGIEGENDFSGKRYVWLKDPQAAFVKGWIVEDVGGNRILVQCDDGSVSDRRPMLPLTPTPSRPRGHHLILIQPNSSERSMLRARTRSIQQSSTKQTTWLS